MKAFVSKRLGKIEVIRATVTVHDVHAGAIFTTKGLHLEGWDYGPWHHGQREGKISEIVKQQITVNAGPLAVGILTLVRPTEVGGSIALHIGIETRCEVTIYPSFFKGAPSTFIKEIW